MQSILFLFTTITIMTNITKYQLSLLLEKQKLGICTKAEEDLLNNWFDNNPEIEAITFASEEEKEKIKSEIGIAIKARINNTLPITKNSKTRKFWSVGSAAAVVAIISIASFYYFQQGRVTNDMIVVVAPKGVEHMPVTLPDSSTVVLSAGSSVSYREHFDPGARTIALTGEAYFSVRPNKKAPFIVNTGKQVSVKVLGTSFVVDVNKTTEQVDISVITGLVQIDEGKKKLDVLRPGEQLRYSCPDRTFSKKKYLSEDVAQWQNNSIIYLSKVSLTEIAILLKTMYHVDLNFDQKRMGHYRFNMSFSKNLSIDEVLGILNTVSGLKFARNKKEVSICE
jgi:transmembrane sensor